VGRLELPSYDLLGTVAAAYAEAHDFDRAVETESRAIELSKSWKLSNYFGSPPWPGNIERLVAVYSRCNEEWQKRVGQGAAGAWD
jgi:hypothetical protein